MNAPHPASTPIWFCRTWQIDRFRISPRQARCSNAQRLGLHGGRSFHRQAAFSPGNGPQISNTPGTGPLKGDVNGDGTADFYLHFDGAPKLTANDFLF